MTQYLNFVTDFPTRCNEILSTYTEDATRKGREVTLMLAIASAGINVPYERLAKSNHPSRNRENLTTARELLDDLSEQYFLSSELCQNDQGENDQHSWKYGGPLRTVEGEPRTWPELGEPDAMQQDETVGTVLRHVRNALAHGNIFTYESTTTAGEIQSIIFLSKPKMNAPQFNYLIVSPTDFHKFLRSWFRFLKHLEPDISREVTTRGGELA